MFVDEMSAVVDDIWEDDMDVIDDDLPEEAEDEKLSEELVLEELPELSDLEEPAELEASAELLTAPPEELTELSEGSTSDGFPELGSTGIEPPEDAAVEVPDDCRLSPDEIGSSVIPFHSEDEVLLSVTLPSELCKPTSTIFTELLLSEISELAQPLNRSTAVRAAAKNLFFIFYFPHLCSLLFVFVLYLKLV